MKEGFPTINCSNGYDPPVLLLLLLLFTGVRYTEDKAPGISLLLRVRAVRCRLRDARNELGRLRRRRR